MRHSCSREHKDFTFFIASSESLLLFLFSGSEKLRSKREALNYEETRVISSTNNDYDDNPSWGYAKPKLTCYSCYRSIDGDDCVTLKDTSKLVEQSCEGEHDQCMVCLLRMYTCVILKRNIYVLILNCSYETAILYYVHFMLYALMDV